MSPSICIVLDTSVLYDDYKLGRAPLRELLNIAKLCSAHVILPKVVFDEQVNHFKWEYQNSVSKIKNAIKKLRELPLVDNVDSSTPVISGSYEEFLQHTAQEHDIQIADYPSVSHEDVLKRTLKKRKPFGDKDKGYKDTLIWETILELLSNRCERVVFIVANHTDFAGLPAGSLHSDLIKDLGDHGFTDGSVALKLSIKEASNYLREVGGLNAASLIELIAEQIKDSVDFDDLLTEHSNDIVECIETDSGDILIGEGADEPSFLWNVEEAEIEIETTEVVENGEVVVYASAEFENELMYWMFLSSYYTNVDYLEVVGITPCETDEKIDSAWVSGNMVLSLHFSFVYNPSNQQVSGFKALRIYRVDLGAEN